jgi:hypothetical protein
MNFKMPVPSLLLLSVFLSGRILAQESSEKQPNLLKSKDQIIAGATLSYLPSWYIKKDFRAGSTQAIQYQSQFLKFGILFSNIQLENPQSHLLETFPLREVSIGGTFNFKKLSVGHRLFDIRGILFVPSLDLSFGSMKAGDYSQYNGKITPNVSLQFPYVAIDVKFNTVFRLGKQIPGVKNFSFIPEIGIKFDALYSLLDAEKVYIGHAEGTKKISGTSYSTTSKKEGDYIVTTTYRHDYTRIIPYSIDRYATVIGPIAAIGPHYGFQNLAYSGPTRTFGIGYYLRGGILSADFIYDFGKIGFASSMEETQTISNPKPDPLGKVNKKDFSNPGYYRAHRFQARIGMDLIELYYSTFGKSLTVERGQGKFTRVIGGIGLGYAALSSPNYENAQGRFIADSIFDNDYTRLSTSANHAKFGSNGTFLTLYCSLEAGAIRVTFESNRYFRANLANVKSISVAYMFPYNRIKKKMIAIRSLKHAD